MEEKYIKIEQDFFERDDIRCIEGTENGDKKIFIYLYMVINTLETKGKIYIIAGEYCISQLIIELEKWVGISYKNIEETIKILLSLQMISIINNEYIQINDYEKIIS